MTMQPIGTPKPASAHGSVWGDFPISCTIQENGSSRAFEGSLGWNAHPQSPGISERDVLLHLAESKSDSKAGDTSPGGMMSLGNALVDGLAAGRAGAKKALMGKIQEKWPGLVSYSFPPA